ncbi:hypothetical protein Agub_g9984, partial [Astrephomene gubernaculifera]
RPSEAAPALACIGAILQHPAGLSGRQQQRPGQDAQQVCADMGRGCDAASVSVLLDLLARAAADGSSSGSPRTHEPAPGVLELLPLCLHSPDTRASVLRHSSGLRVVLVQAAQSDARAAAVLKRLGGDDQLKTAVARQLSQALTIDAICSNDRHVASLA